ncbi:hypothetical protein CALVIDRAFT_561078 [Calocera viscosa TUFC12733]|uniref:Uncharacterized protein n=1 Tax=Calocera viscosa (strain TUFC12733) TaxID=1330018 RepID=A0A167QGX2_CALVF|nr:hypothetical protein CALVIDRAFT_561078 [Calocera viscosa TUFC12733]
MHPEFSARPVKPISQSSAPAEKNVSAVHLPRLENRTFAGHETDRESKFNGPHHLMGIIGHAEECHSGAHTTIHAKGTGAAGAPSTIVKTSSMHGSSSGETELTGDPGSDCGTSSAITSVRELDLIDMKVENLREDEVVAIIDWAISMRQYPSPSLLRGKTFGHFDPRQFPPEFSMDVEDIEPVFESPKGGLCILTRGLGAWGPMKVVAYSQLGNQMFIQLPSDAYDVLYRFQDAFNISKGEEDRWRILPYTIFKGDRILTPDDDDDVAQCSHVRVDQVLADRAVCYDRDALRGTNRSARQNALRRLGFFPHITS